MPTPDLGRAFSLDRFAGWIAEAELPLDAATAITLLTDPARCERTLHWGRNHLSVVVLDVGGETRRYVVKEFRHDTVGRRLRRRWRGDKAQRSWLAAAALIRAGIATPSPALAAVGSRIDDPSYYVCRYLDDAIEARALLRQVRDPATASFSARQIEAFLHAAADLARRLHDAGIRHRDFSMGNLLVRWQGDAADVALVDLNRTRVGGAVGLLAGLAELSRLDVASRSLREKFLIRYLGHPPAAWERISYEALRRSFLLKNPLKRRVRGGLRAVFGWFAPQMPPPPHVPKPEAGGARQAVSWDPLSAQPHHHRRPIARIWARLRDAPELLREATRIVADVPDIRRRLRAVPPAAAPGALGVGLAGETPPTPELFAALEQLGIRDLYLRLHAFAPLDAPERLARALAERGYRLAFGIAQDRSLITDTARAGAALDDLAGRFTPLGDWFQIGQAINRSKWGIWTPSEYVAFAARAAAALQARSPRVRLAGPAVIDFEPHVMAGALTAVRGRVTFDRASSLLYVDRRGAPENRQLGQDLEAKLRWMSAIAGNIDSGRLWISEFNWPLAAGPHSPAGRREAVTEEEQADYLVRYVLLALASGRVARLDWWQLAARGYGLLDPQPDGSLRPRPAFHALAHLARRLDGATAVTSTAPETGTREVRVDRPDGSIRVRWCPQADVESERNAATAVFDRDGQALEGRAIRVGGSPTYWVDGKP